MAEAKGKYPRAYIEGNEDPRLRKRIVPMEVFSTNFSRTGTMSMKAALEILGYPTWHHVVMSANPPDIDMWYDALLLKFDPEAAARKGLKPFGRKEWDNLLGYWSATTEQPAAILTEELINAYPDAKVIYVERDVDSWYRSYCNGVIESSWNPWIPLASFFDSFFMARMCRFTDLVMQHYFDVPIPRTQYGLFNRQDTKEIYEAHAKDTYIKHREMVMRVTPKERLLVFRLQEGWGPLCEFLGKPVPDVPFPWVNETAAVRELVGKYIANSYKMALRRTAWKMLPVVVVVVAALMAWRWRPS